MKKDLLVPDIGDFENVEIIELLVKQGQKISIKYMFIRTSISIKLK